MIEDAKIKEIIEKTDIVALVSQYVSLTKAGSDYKGLCPFHEEKTPSFMVSPSKKIAKCMGCGKGGNPITFLMQIKNIGFEDACIELAQKANIELNIVKKNTGPDLSKYYKIMEEAAKFYHYNLLSTKSGALAIKYLENRGVSKEIIDEFNIGLAPDKSDALYLTLKDLGYNEIDMMDCGLIKASDKDNSFYDLFRKRITFPVTDRFSHIIAFSARIYNGEQDTAKYINSPETIIFKKNQSIFHLDLAQPHILKKKRVILHEGQLDVIASTKSGLGEAVCSMGTALTSNQVKLLKTFTDNIVVCYDGDSAGVNAMMKAIKLFKKEGGFNVELVRLPDGMDPDEYVQKYGSEEYVKYFEEHIENPNDFIYQYYTKDKNFNDLAQIDETKNQIFTFLKSLNSRVLVESYLNRFSQDTGVSQASLFLDYNSFVNGANNEKVLNKNSTEIKQDIKINSQISPKGYTEEEWQNLLFRLRCELKLFVYARKSKKIALSIDKEVDHNVPIYACFDSMHQILWDELINTYYGMYDTYNEGDFLALLNDQKYYNCIVSDKKTLYNLYQKEPMPDNSKDMNDCIKNIFISYDMRLTDKSSQLRGSDLSFEQQQEELAKIVKNLQKIDKKRKDLKSRDKENKL